MVDFNDDHSHRSSRPPSRRSSNSGPHNGNRNRTYSSNYRDDASIEHNNNAPIWVGTEEFEQEDDFSYSPIVAPMGTIRPTPTIVGTFRPALEDMVEVNVSAHGKRLMDGDAVFRTRSGRVRRSSIFSTNLDDLGLEAVSMSRRRGMLIALGCGLIIGLSVMLGIVLSPKNQHGDSPRSPLVDHGDSSNPGSQTFNPWYDETLTVDECDFTGILQPDVFLQCRCHARLSVFSTTVLSTYTTLKKDFVENQVFHSFNHKMDSCSPANVALAWLATDDFPHDRSTKDRYMLALLFAAWRGFAWDRQDNWLLTSESHCKWHGVTCDSYGHTIELTLNDNNLQGIIPTEIVKFDTLTSLSVATNNIHGRIPRELGDFSNLQKLRLSGNKLSGTIPTEFGILGNLKSLELDNNGLRGPIPTELMRLPLLEYIGLFSNGLTGTIPTEITLLSNCHEFRIHSNAISGEIPTEIGNMEMLRVWESGRNACKGIIPTEIGRISTLFAFDVSAMGLTGSIPSQVGLLTALETFAVSSNNLAGNLPATLSKMTAMEYLFLDHNFFVGSIPSQISQMQDLKVLYMQNNTFTGTVPSQLAQCSSLMALDLSGNRLNGVMPNEICGLQSKSLETLVSGCGKDTLECTVPDCCTKCSA